MSTFEEEVNEIEENNNYEEIINILLYISNPM